MEQNYLSRAAKYLADLRRRKAWKKVVSGLGTVVVFCTVYALILPAITLTRPTICGLEEHHHDESCYTMVSPIAATVQLPQQVCTVESVYADLEPGVAHASFVLHVHDENCYQDGQLICQLPEIEPHVHDASCYEMLPGPLICGYGTASDGTGGETVPGGEQTPPPQETMVPHVHTDACYATNSQLICGKMEGEGAVEGHTHTDDCYAMEPVQTVTCGITEEGHEHTETCYTTEMIRGELTCGRIETPAIEGHQHTAECYQQTQELTCEKQEGELEPTTVYIDDPEVPVAYSAEQPLADIGEGDIPLSYGGEENLGGAGEPAVQPHVHDETCYGPSQEVLTCGSEYTPHEHGAECYDVNGNLICGRVVTRVHVHTEECFQQGGDLELIPSLTCGKEEHDHTDACYESGPDRAEQEQKWGALFWSGIVSEYSDTIMDASTIATWMDTESMDVEALEALRNAPAQDLSRKLDASNTGIRVDTSLYNKDNHGPLDPEAPFSVLLTWNLDAGSFAVDTETTTTTAPAQEPAANTDINGYTGDPALALLSATEPVTTTTTTVTARGTLTYTYSFPEGIVVENVEKRVLNDTNTGNVALSYMVQDNVLTVVYYAPAESVTTSFSLKANWAEGVAENEAYTISWNYGVFTEVAFASPELTLEKSMGENGLRVEEDGTVWADYTVTVTNSSVVGAKDITLTDTLESEYFHFYRGGASDGAADYSVTVTTPGEEGAEPVSTESFETFPAEYDGGNILAFPAFDLAAGESRVFRYTAQMSAEEREAVDEIILAEAEQLPQGQRPSGITVSNIATVTCPGSKTPELTAKAQATYGGPDSKHIEDVTAEYHGDTFDATFTVNGDAILPPGITAERVEELGVGNFLLKVQKFDEGSEEYQEFAQLIDEGRIVEPIEEEPVGEAEIEEVSKEAVSSEESEESKEKGKQLELSVLGLELRYNSMRLDLSNCDVTMVVEPNEALKKYHEPVVAKAAADEEGETEETQLGSVIELAALTKGEVTDALGGVGAITELTKEGSATLEAEIVLNNDMVEVSQDSIVDAQEAEPFTVTMNANRRVALLAQRSVQKTFKVKYFATLDMLEFGETVTNIPIIDTSGAQLPKNTETSDCGVKYLDFVSEKDRSFKTNEKTVPIYSASDVPYSEHVLWKLGDFKIVEQYTYGNIYEVSGVKVVDSGGNVKIMAGVTDDKGNLDLNSVPAGIRLGTKNADGSIEQLVKAGDTVEITFKVAEEGSYTNSALFHDYDITDGKVYTDSNYQNTLNRTKTSQSAYEEANQSSILYAKTSQYGINTDYTEEGGNKLAFGNANTGVSLQNEKTDGGYLINAYNRKDSSNGSPSNGKNNVFQGCSFELAQKTLGEDGAIVFNVNAPKDLFGTGTRTGKTSSTYNLEFKRVGDSYTLREVVGTNATGLDTLYKTGYANNRINTNEFWPMDSATSYGTEGHDLKFGSFDKKTRRRFGPSAANHTFPISDFPWTGSSRDVDHNSYFGMEFEAEFEVKANYVGPLEYVFFGDDDLWLYLDGQLICDIGGVHSTVGEYVDLWDYLGTTDEAGNHKLNADAVGTHTLKLYYTERGASGSTCWMQFTLPAMQEVPKYVPADPKLSNLYIEKKVEGVQEDKTEYNFLLKVDKDRTTVEFEDHDSAVIYPSCLLVSPGKEDELLSEITANQLYAFTLKAGEQLYIKNLPAGTTYDIWELPDSYNDYDTSVEGKENGSPLDLKYDPNKSTGSSEYPSGKHVGGKTGGDEQSGSYTIITYTNTFHYSLPETGGPGDAGQRMYTLVALPVMAAAVLVYKRSRKKGGTVS